MGRELAFAVHEQLDSVYVELRCPTCRRIFHRTRHWRHQSGGLRVICPACGAVHRVPDGETDA